MSAHFGNILFVGLEKPVNVAINGPISVEQLKKAAFPDQSDTLYLCRGGCPLSDNDVLTPSPEMLVLSAHLRLCGGKGGFGSLIRATGSHRNRNADKSACRDITGRRVRDIKDEKKLAEWMAAEKERKRERTERKKRRLQRMLEEPKHKFEDTSYMESIKSTQEGMADSLKLGLQQDTSAATAGPAPKKPKLWMPSEDLSSSEDEEELSDTDSDDSDSCGSEKSPAIPPPEDITGSTPSPTDTQSSANNQSSATEEPNATEEPKTTEKSEESTAKQVCEEASTSNTSPPAVCEDTSAQPPATSGVSDDPPTTSSSEEIDLSQHSSVEDLLALGGEALKRALSRRGLKCGGTPLERAQRLFSIKGLTQQQIPKNLWAKKKKN